MPITELKVKDIKPGENYRRHQDKGGMKELTASVRSHGVLQPIIVRKNGKGYEIIAGHRRHAAAIAAGLKTVPASVVKADDAEALEIAVIENTQREDPNPMDEGLGFKRLLDLGKHTPESLSKKLDKSLSYVYTRLKLNDLPKDCQKALLDGTIELGHALVLCRMSEKKDQSEMLREMLDQDMSIGEAREHLRDYYGAPMPGAIFDKTGCAKCPSRSTTQASLFPGVDGTDDRCMDEKCFRARTLDALKKIAEKEASKGRMVICDLAEIRRLDRKGAKIKFDASLKQKCQKCMERSFYHAADEDRVVYGWHCPSKKCHDETVLGIKPSKPGPGERSEEKKIRLKQEAVEALWDMDTKFLEEWAAAKAGAPDGETLRLQLVCLHLLDHVAEGVAKTLLTPHVAPGTDLDNMIGWASEDEDIWKVLSAVPAADLPQLARQAIAAIPQRIEPEVLRKICSAHGLDYGREFRVSREWLETLDADQLGCLCEEFGTMVTADGPLDKTTLIDGLLAADITGKVPKALQQQIDQVG